MTSSSNNVEDQLAKTVQSFIAANSKAAIAVWSEIENISSLLSTPSREQWVGKTERALTALTFDVIGYTTPIPLLWAIAGVIATTLVGFRLSHWAPLPVGAVIAFVFFTSHQMRVYRHRLIRLNRCFSGGTPSNIVGRLTNLIGAAMASNVTLQCSVAIGTLGIAFLFGGVILYVQNGTAVFESEVKIGIVLVAAAILCIYLSKLKWVARASVAPPSLWF